MVGSSRRALFLVVLILVTCGFLGIVFGQKINPSAAPGGDTDVRDSLRQFATVYDVVEQNYAEPVNPDKAIYNGAIPGMLHVLDPHSNFFDPKAYSLLREDQRGKYYGVGMTVGPRNNKVIVIAPFVGTPAYRAIERPDLYRWRHLDVAGHLGGRDARRRRRGGRDRCRDVGHP